jgi:hypothetical protein
MRSHGRKRVSRMIYIDRVVVGLQIKRGANKARPLMFCNRDHMSERRDKWRLCGCHWPLLAWLTQWRPCYHCVTLFCAWRVASLNTSVLTSSVSVHTIWRSRLIQHFINNAICIVSLGMTENEEWSAVAHQRRRLHFATSQGNHQPWNVGWTGWGVSLTLMSYTQQDANSRGKNVGRNLNSPLIGQYTGFT